MPQLAEFTGSILEMGTDPQRISGRQIRRFSWMICCSGFRITEFGEFRLNRIKSFYVIFVSFGFHHQFFPHQHHEPFRNNQTAPNRDLRVSSPRHQR